MSNFTFLDCIEIRIFDTLKLKLHSTLRVDITRRFIVMHTKHIQSLWAGILFFYLMSPVAFATPEEDTANAEKSFNGEDVKEATRLLRSAADQNYFPAQIRMGEFMHASDEDEESFGWFLTAAYQGDAAGQFNLGQMYANGFGIEANPEKAFYWSKKSAEQNFLPAVQLMAGAYKERTNHVGKIIEGKNSLGLLPDQTQADFWSAKLPELEKIEAKRIKKLQAAQAKRNAELLAAEKAKQSKLLCGLKC
jgi:TPR repeat protein